MYSLEIGSPSSPLTAFIWSLSVLGKNDICHMI